VHRIVVRGLLCGQCKPGKMLTPVRTALIVSGGTGYTSRSAKVHGNQATQHVSGMPCLVVTDSGAGLQFCVGMWGLE
jgi:hypothetical protein